MGLAEIVTRTRQEASKRIERWMPAPCGVGPLRSRRARAGGLRMVRDAFFPGATAPEVSALLAGPWAADVHRLRAAAEASRTGRFDLLGYRGLSFGDPVDWHLDPVSGRRSPRLHWSRIDPLDPGVVGDSKVVWELNRHQWLVTLAQAFRLGQEEEYAEACFRYLEAWMRDNPRGLGINWASSLEVALRIVSWCWALALLEGARAASRERVQELVLALAAHASHVGRYLSEYFSPNTHLTGEALGLFYAGVLLPEHPEARGWRARGAAILEREVGRQVLKDGVYFEQATCYQRYTVEICLHFLILARRAGVGVSPGVGAAVQRMLDCLLSLRHPCGTMPQIGDGDGGCLLPLAPRDPGDLRGVFAVAASYFRRGDYAWAAGGPAPEVAWLLGGEGCRAFESLLPRPPSTGPSRIFPEGGHAVMSSGWEPAAHRLRFDVGPLGCPVSGGHGHADLLSIECSVFGEPCVVDPGTYVYTGAREWRNHFRSTRAHSTATVDEREQAVPTGPFAWAARPSARLRRWRSTAVFDYADAEHDAFARSGEAVVHRRRVLFLKPRGFVLLDDLAGAHEHRVDLRLQLAPLPVSLDSTGWVRVRVSGGRGLLLRCLAAVPFAVSVHEGETDPIRGWVSPDYGRREPAPLVMFSARSVLPLRAFTLLLPSEDLDAQPPTVDLVGGESDRLLPRLRSGLRSGGRRLIPRGGYPCAASSESSPSTPGSTWTRSVSAGCGTSCATAVRTGRGSTSTVRSASATGASRSWTSRVATSRCPTRMGRPGSRSTARSTTTPPSVRASWPEGTSTARAATPRPSSTCTRRRGTAAPSGSPACSRSRCGTGGSVGSCSRGTASGSSRSITR